MKIKNKEIKECENKDGTKTNVLDIEYSHRGEIGRVLIKDYNPDLEDEYIKEIRKQVRNLYIQEKLKQEA